MSVMKIGLWPQLLINSLPNNNLIEKRALISKQTVSSQIYLWQALNIYDDILDEGKNIEKLPLANYYFRSFLQIFYESKPPLALKNKAEKLWKNLEKFHQLELKQGKIFWVKQKIQYSSSTLILKLNNLADKSLVLAIMPIALAWQQKQNLSTREIKKLFSLFKCLLITKQLADDVKDWEDDLQAGKLTIVTKFLLDKLKQEKIKINKKNYIYQAKIIFIKTSALTFSQQIINAAQKTKKIADELNIGANSSLLTELLYPLEKRALKIKKILTKNKIIDML